MSAKALKFPSRSLAKFVVRLPDGLRERIEAAARAKNRSMNAEIVRVLELGFPEDGGALAGGDLVIKANSAGADILIELQHQLGQVTKMIEERLPPLKTGGRKLARPPSKKKA
jgi:hypothetical protein